MRLASVLLAFLIRKARNIFEHFQMFLQWTPAYIFPVEKLVNVFDLSAMALKAGTNQESSPCLMSNPSFLFETRMGRSGRQMSEGLSPASSYKRRPLYRLCSEDVYFCPIQNKICIFKSNWSNLQNCGQWCGSGSGRSLEICLLNLDLDP